MDENGIPRRSIFCIKDNLKKSLGVQLENDVEGNLPRTRLWRLINDYVSRARDITIRMSMLDHLHTLRMCQDFERGNRNAFVEHDQEYYCDLARAVCGIIVTTVGLQDTVDEEYSRIFPANEALHYVNMSAFMAEIANDSVQNFNEHISRNTKPIFCRLMILRMNLDPEFHDSAKIKGKLALHIFKLLSNQMTVWPHSVPETEARLEKCQILIEQYFPWFEFLLINNDNEEDQDEEEEDDDDDPIDLDNIPEEDDPMDLDYLPEEDQDEEDDDDDPIDLDNIPEEDQDEEDEDDFMDIDNIPEDQENIDVHRNLDPWFNRRGPMNNRVLNGYPNKIRATPTLFLPLVYKTLQAIEAIKDRIGNEQEVRRFPTPINQIPRGYLGELFRRTLSKGLRNEMYPKNYWLEKRSRQSISLSKGTMTRTMKFISKPLEI